MTPLNLVSAVALWHFLAAHQVAATAIATSATGWIFSAWSETMRVPEKPTGGYAFFFKLVHLIAANLTRARQGF